MILVPIICFFFNLGSSAKKRYGKHKAETYSFGEPQSDSTTENDGNYRFGQGQPRKETPKSKCVRSSYTSFE